MTTGSPSTPIAMDVGPEALGSTTYELAIAEQVSSPQELTTRAPAKIALMTGWVMGMTGGADGAIAIDVPMPENGKELYEEHVTAEQ